MITDTRAIVLRQVRTINSRRVIVLFTEKFGKISAGVTVSERRNGKASLAMQPFTLGNYELFRSRDNYHLNKGQVLKSFYGLGQDVEKYMAASYGMELCDRMLEEWQPVPEIFGLTVDFLETMEKRKERFNTLELAYQVKLMYLSGIFPGDREGLSALISESDFAIIDVLQFMLDHPLARFEKLALDPAMEQQITTLLDGHLAEQYDLGEMKSQRMFFSPGE